MKDKLLEEIKSKIKENGYLISFVAFRSRCSMGSLRSFLNGKKELTEPSMKKLLFFLGIKNPDKHSEDTAEE